MVERKPSYKEIHPYYLLGLVEFIVSIWTTASFGVYSYVCCMEFILFFSKFIFFQLSQHNLAKLIFAQWFAVLLLSNIEFLYIYLGLFWDFIFHSFGLFICQYLTLFIIDSVCVCVCVCVCEVASVRVQLFATLWTVVFQAPLSRAFSMTRILEWVAIPSSRGSPWPRDWTPVSYVYCIGRWVLYHWHHLENPIETS